MSIKNDNPTLLKGVILQSFERALHLAVEKWGATAPNPSVACILLDKEGRFLASGVHPYAGAVHAEIMALKMAEEKGALSAVYHAIVTLEPCAHHGKTPPCVQALLESPVQKIWIGARDLNPLASGGGEMLKNPPLPYHGREVFFADEDEELLDIAQECQSLLAPFASSILKKRPWITVKQALNRLGTMIPEPGKKTFTSPRSLLLAHRLRRASDAIVTAYGTIIKDYPSFTVRHLEDHPNMIADDAVPSRKQRLLLVGTRKKPAQMPPLFLKWQQEREAEGFIVKFFASLEEMLEILCSHSIHWVLVEAGPEFLEVLKEASLWDEWLVMRQAQEDGGEDLLSILTQNAHISPLSLLFKYDEDDCSDVRL